MLKKLQKLIADEMKAFDIKREPFSESASTGFGLNPTSLGKLA